ncbi:hypothetical protein GCM10023081_32650 [Arthrobacter ginkgonis]|uniref:Uncharacterized protein n=1 Tax=Arthrobacter ginkgonis TaxID=1630594 RepID=A0ABP7CPQ0_9MICC
MTQTSQRQEKDCRLFEAVQTNGRTTVHPDPRDWDQSLARFGELDATKRVAEDVIYEPMKSNGRYQLTMHRPINKQFMSRIGEDNHITDMLVDSNERHRFAYSSTVIFSEHQTIFGVVKGDRSAPSHQDVCRFLAANYSCPEGFRWEVRALPSPSELDRMRNADGINLFSTKFSTFRDLFSDEGEEDDISEYVNRLASKFGSDIEVFLEVRLPRSTRGMEPARRMKAFFSRDLKTTVGRGRGSKARIVSQNGEEELVHLLEHDLAISFDIPGSGSEKARFSQLVDGLESIRSELNASVESLLRR